MCSVANWAKNLKPSANQKLLAAGEKKIRLSFGLGLPAIELFPVEQYRQSILSILSMMPQALQYVPPIKELKTYVVDIMRERGVRCSSDQIFLTAGAQQGISMLARLLLNPHGLVIAEELIYSGFLQAIAPLEPEILTVSTDTATGIDVDAVEVHLQNVKRPAFIYAITDGHNPLGVSMSPAKRVRLVELAKKYKIPIIEDDPYGLLFYNESIPPLRSLDKTWVYYVGSFSKILAPLLRVGWLVVPEHLIEKLSILKEGTDLNTATFSQRTVVDFLAKDHLPKHLVYLRHEYKNRREAMLTALTKYFPKGTRFQVPNNGMFIWVELPHKVDTLQLLNLSIETEGIAFLPGIAFAFEEKAISTHCMRLNFSCCNPEQINYGIKKLAAVIIKYSKALNINMDIEVN